MNPTRYRPLSGMDAHPSGQYVSVEDYVAKCREYEQRLAESAAQLAAANDAGSIVTGHYNFEKNRADHQQARADAHVLTNASLHDRIASMAAELESTRRRADANETKLNALRLVCGTTDANKFETAYDRVAADRDTKAEENNKLRQIISGVVMALGNGSRCAPDASIEFMRSVPHEVRRVIAELRNDQFAALTLVSKVRGAIGDHGNRMQDDLIAYCAELSEDKARLDWLAGNGGGFAHDEQHRGICTQRWGTWAFRITPNEFRAALDAVRKKTEVRV